VKDEGKGTVAAENRTEKLMTGKQRPDDKWRCLKAAVVSTGQ
jgi:hypothetical protein